MPTQHDSRILQHIATGSGMTILDVVGLTVESLADPRTRPAIPPGAVVPIHSHDSTETLLVISGIKQALVPGDHGPECKDVQAGERWRLRRGPGRSRPRRALPTRRGYARATIPCLVLTYLSQMPDPYNWLPSL